MVITLVESPCIIQNAKIPNSRIPSLLAPLTAQNQVHDYNNIILWQVSVSAWVCVITTNKQPWWDILINRIAWCRRWHIIRHRQIALAYALLQYRVVLETMAFIFGKKTRNWKNKNNDVILCNTDSAEWRTISIARSTGQKTAFPPAWVRKSLGTYYIIYLFIIA